MVGEVYLDPLTGEDYYPNPSDRPQQASEEASSNAPARTYALRAPYLTRAAAHALKGNGPCWLEQELTDESIVKMAGSYETVNPMLDEVWLRETLQTINADLGNVPTAHVRRALRSAFAYAARRLPIPFGEKGHVKFPREFTAHLIVSELSRQSRR